MPGMKQLLNPHVLVNKITLLAGICLFMQLQLNAQDVITKRNGTEVQAKVLEITAAEVKFKRFDNPSGPLYILPVSGILTIRYENGTKDTFNQSPVVAAIAASSDTATADSAAQSIGDLRVRAEQDAQEYYVGKNSGSGWTAFFTVLTSPLIGLIPAAACASTEPQKKNLSYPDPELMKQYDYEKAYTQKAHKIKKRQVWSGYLTGSVMWLLLVVLLVN
jgi:hypothetical protein